MDGRPGVGPGPVHPNMQPRPLAPLVMPPPNYDPSSYRYVLMGYTWWLLYYKPFSLLCYALGN